MHEDMRILLNAYLDGELHDRRLLELQNHLASCAACRNELKELGSVSDLLQAAPAPESIPVERFVSQLTLLLPRRTVRDRPVRPGNLAWWLVPAGLIGAWFFVQTAITLTDALTAASMSGLIGQTAGWLGGGQESAWFGAITSLISRQAVTTQASLSMLNNVSVFTANLVGGFLWQAAIVLLYWAWLAAWWLRRGSRPITANGS
jgi:anti-sigma factor RsiW